MKLPPFTLVYRPERRDVQRQGRERSLAADLGEHAAGLEFSLDALKPAIRRSLLATVAPAADRAGAAGHLAQAVTDLRRQAKVETVGFWDLSSQVGELPRVIEALNRVQPVFTFFEVQAAVPSGLISRPERVIAWAAEELERPLSTDETREIGSNVIFEDFAARARRVRRQLGLDHLIGVAPAMIAFEEEGTLYWNYFTMGEPRLLLVSTFAVAGYARKAGRPFEVAVAMLALSTLLATLNPKLDFHEEVRGCLFDFNRERSTLVKSLREVKVGAECVDKIRPKYRQATLAMVEALRGLGTNPAAPAAAGSGRAAARKDSSSKNPKARPRGPARQ